MRYRECLKHFHNLGSFFSLYDKAVEIFQQPGMARKWLKEPAWAKLGPWVDGERFERVTRFLAIQGEEAKWGRDASLAYFSAVSGRPLPEGRAPPAHTLEHYRALTFPNAPGDG